MDASSSVAELRMIRDLPGQRVLEGVLSLRIEHFLVEELRARERMESGGKVSLAEIGHALENRLGEPRADHRRRLVRRVESFGEPAVDISEHPQSFFLLALR